MLPFVLSFCLATGAMLPHVQAAERVSVVNLLNHTGNPQHYASGLLYGIPEAPDAIPDHFYTDIGFNFFRAGGTQVPEGGHGWNTGVEDYQARMNWTMSNYHTTRKYGGRFILLTADLWGADAAQNESSLYPGDNDDWTHYDNFLDQVATDLRANNALEGMQFDIWNEPDLTTFWHRSQDQYLEMWGRGYGRIRELLPEVEIIGPSTSSSPGLSNSWWTNFAEFVHNNQTIPEQWAWHMETGGGDMESTNAALLAVLDQYDLPWGPLNINEYATAEEQTPAFSAWWTAQVERVNAIGLRGNWYLSTVLDCLTGLLTKSNGTYYLTAEYQVYKYYHLNMTGTRVGTSPSADKAVDTYSTISKDRIRILYGSRSLSDTSYIQVDNLSSVGLPENGELKLSVYAFPFTDGRDGIVLSPSDLGYSSPIPYSDDTLSIPVYPTDNTTAYAFEIEL